MPLTVRRRPSLPDTALSASQRAVYCAHRAPWQQTRGGVRHTSPVASSPVHHRRLEDEPRQHSATERFVLEAVCTPSYPLSRRDNLLAHLLHRYRVTRHIAQLPLLLPSPHALPTAPSI